MATITTDGADLVVDVHGLDKLWTLTSRLTIPIEHVRGATADPGMMSEPTGRRGPGAHIRCVIVAGTFRQDGQTVFWDVHHKDNVVVIELRDETYQRLVIEVDDPRATVDTIERALAAH